MADLTITIPTQATATHCTLNLPGFPARDIAGYEGEAVFAPEAGTVYDAHLIPWSGGPHGVGGWTFYFLGVSGRIYFVTHLSETDQPISNGRVPAGFQIGVLAGTTNSGAPVGWTVHVHVGSDAYTGLDCGQIPSWVYRLLNAGGPPLPAARGERPPGKKVAPVSVVDIEAATLHLPQAWQILANTLGKTMPTYSAFTNRMSNLFKDAVR